MSDGSETRVTDIAFAGDVIIAETDGGTRLRAPLEFFPRLLAASPEERANWRLIAQGEGVHWPEIDEDLPVSAFLAADRRC